MKSTWHVRGQAVIGCEEHGPQGVGASGKWAADGLLGGRLGC